MQSGLGKSDKWVIEFETEDTGINPLMGWETSYQYSFRIKLRIFF